MKTLTLVSVLVACGSVLTGQARTLDIYWIDTEGGASTLIVTAAIRRAVAREGSSAHDSTASARSPATLAVVSLVLWTGAIAAGRLMAYL